MPNPTVGLQSRVIHSNDPVTIIDFPYAVSVIEFGATGNGVTDDSAAINSAYAALASSGVSLFFPTGTYLVTANALANLTAVPNIIAPGATFTGTQATTFATAAQPFKARNVCTSLSGAYTGTGTSTLTASANAAFGAQDGVTNVVGDVVLLQGGTVGTAITAADVGPWVLTAAGAAGAKWVLQRPGWWPTGGIMPVMASIQVGPEGTVFFGTSWSAWASPGAVIGTTDPSFFPDRVIFSGTMSTGSGTLIITTVPLRSATKTIVAPTIITVAGTNTAAVTVQPLTITPGYIGTSTVTIQTLASAFATNAVAATDVLNVLIANR